MPTNDFKPFATGVGANVISQADYIIAAWLATGFPVSGMDKTAYSNALNKVWRQSAFMAAMIGQFIETELAIDVLDDGNLAGKTTNFIAAIQAMINAVAGNYDPAGAAAAVSALALKKASNLSDLASVPTALTNLGIVLKNIPRAWFYCDNTGAVLNSSDPLGILNAVTKSSGGTFEFGFSGSGLSANYSTDGFCASGGIREAAGRNLAQCTFQTYDITNGIVSDQGNFTVRFYF